MPGLGCWSTRGGGGETRGQHCPTEVPGLAAQREPPAGLHMAEEPACPVQRVSCNSFIPYATRVLWLVSSSLLTAASRYKDTLRVRKVPALQKTSLIYHVEKEKKEQSRLTYP